MTRKHFAAIAYELRRQRPTNLPPYGQMSDWERGAYDEWCTVVIGMADTLYAFNGRFQRDRFYAACGFEG